MQGPKHAVPELVPVMDVQESLAQRGVVSGFAVSGRAIGPVGTTGIAPPSRPCLPDRDARTRPERDPDSQERPLVQKQGTHDSQRQADSGTGADLSLISDLVHDTTSTRLRPN